MQDKLRKKVEVIAKSSEGMEVLMKHHAEIKEDASLTDLFFERINYFPCKHVSSREGYSRLYLLNATAFYFLTEEGDGRTLRINGFSRRFSERDHSQDSSLELSKNNLTFEYKNKDSFFLDKLLEGKKEKDHSEDLYWAAFIFLSFGVTVAGSSEGKTALDFLEKGALKSLNQRSGLPLGAKLCTLELAKKSYGAKDFSRAASLCGFLRSDEFSATVVQEWIDAQADVGVKITLLSNYVKSCPNKKFYKQLRDVSCGVGFYGQANAFLDSKNYLGFANSLEISASSEKCKTGGVSDINAVSKLLHKFVKTFLGDSNYSKSKHVDRLRKLFMFYLEMFRKEIEKNSNNPDQLKSHDCPLQSYLLMRTNTNSDEITRYLSVMRVLKLEEEIQSFRAEICGMRLKRHAEQGHRVESHAEMKNLLSTGFSTQTLHDYYYARLLFWQMEKLKEKGKFSVSDKLSAKELVIYESIIDSLEKALLPEVPTSCLNTKEKFEAHSLLSTCYLAQGKFRKAIEHRLFALSYSDYLEFSIEDLFKDISESIGDEDASFLAIIASLTLKFQKPEMGFQKEIEAYSGKEKEILDVEPLDPFSRFVNEWVQLEYFDDEVQQSSFAQGIIPEAMRASPLNAELPEESASCGWGEASVALYPSEESALAVPRLTKELVEQEAPETEMEGLKRKLAQAQAENARLVAFAGEQTVEIQVAREETRVARADLEGAREETKSARADLGGAQKEAKSAQAAAKKAQEAEASTARKLALEKQESALEIKKPTEKESEAYCQALRKLARYQKKEIEELELEFADRFKNEEMPNIPSRAASSTGGVVQANKSITERLQEITEWQEKKREKLSERLSELKEELPEVSSEEEKGGEKRVSELA
jgi:hypothetical protein